MHGIVNDCSGAFLQGSVMITNEIHVNKRLVILLESEIPFYAALKYKHHDEANCLSCVILVKITYI